MSDYINQEYNRPMSLHVMGHGKKENRSMGYFSDAGKAKVKWAEEKGETYPFQAFPFDIYVCRM